MTWFGRDLVTARGLTRDDIEEILREAESFSAIARESGSPAVQCKGRRVEQKF